MRYSVAVLLGVLLASGRSMAEEPRPVVAAPLQSGAAAPATSGRADGALPGPGPAALGEEARRLSTLPAAQRPRLAVAARILRGRLDQPPARGTKPRSIEEHVNDSVAAAGLGDAPAAVLAFLVVMEATKSAREEAKASTSTVKAIHAAKACKTVACVAALTPTTEYDRATLASVKDRVKDKLDSLSEMGEMESLRLQMAMDRLSKLMSTLSNLLKKASETASGITQNIK